MLDRNGFGCPLQRFDKEWETKNAGKIAWETGKIDWNIVDGKDLDPSQYVTIVSGLAYHAMLNNTSGDETVKSPIIDSAGI